jgi:signal transduction histidine kinase
MTFDIQTTILMIFLVYIVLHGAIWVVLGGEKSQQVTIWCASGVISGLAVILFASQPAIPKFIFYYVAQMLMVLGNFGRIYALRMYLDGSQSGYYKANIAINVLYMCIFSVLYETGSPDRDLIALFYSFWVFGCLDYIVAGYQIHRKNQFFGGQLVMYAGVVLCSTLGLRALGILGGWGAQGIYEVSWDQGVMLFGQILGITLSNIGFLQIFMAIREQKKIEIQSDLVKAQERSVYLTNHQQELEKLIHEREEIIRQLTLSNKTAGMGALVASIAHELNQPLAAIRLNAQLMEMKLSNVKLDPKEGQAMIEAVLNDNIRASEIIRKLRNMFGSQVADQFQLIDLGKMVGETVDLVRAKARDEGIQIELNIQTNVETVCEITQLQQVVLNLLNNALDSLIESKKPAKQLNIELTKNDDQVILKVQDNGVGIPEHIKNSLFELFKTSKAEGMGVGLWLSLAVAKNHHGTIECESAYGEGATFTVTLPINKGLN